MNATQRFSAKAHIRPNYNYSNFHQSLLHENNREDYALRHIYSLENTKTLLQQWGWTPEQIKAGADYATIDVYEKVVWVHIPNKIVREYKTPFVHTTVKKIKGLSRFISKADFVAVLIKRAWAKADPYKLEPGDSWDELIAKGNTGDFYELKLYSYQITCTCHAYSGLQKAFDQDRYATSALINNPITQGQIPDKHILSAWKYLGAETQRQYEYQFMERRDRFLQEERRMQWENWQEDFDDEAMLVN